jgi:hypothetical protein
MAHGEQRWEDPGRLITPAGFEALECGKGYVLGVQRDHLDVEKLALYDLKIR